MPLHETLDSTPSTTCQQAHPRKRWHHCRVATVHSYNRRHHCRVGTVHSCNRRHHCWVATEHSCNHRHHCRPSTHHFSDFSLNRGVTGFKDRTQPTNRGVIGCRSRLQTAKMARYPHPHEPRRQIPHRKRTTPSALDNSRINKPSTTCAQAHDNSPCVG